MIKIICGGKKTNNWALTACQEYEKRLRKPFDIKWGFYEEEKLAKKLEKWPFSTQDFVIITDERGQNLSSPEIADKINQAFVGRKNIIILVGGAYGFDDEIHKKANFVWSFSRLVFPHMLFRVMLTEQIYRAQEILKGGRYHHE